MISRIETDREDFRSEAIDLDAEGYHLMDMFAEEPYGTDGVVSALFRRRDEVVRLWYPTDGRGVTLSRDIPCASPFERRMAEMSGITFDMGMDPIVYHRKGTGIPSRRPPTTGPRRSASP